jgi:hypothetical protein
MTRIPAIPNGAPLLSGSRHISFDFDGSRCRWDAATGDIGRRQGTLRLRSFASFLPLGTGAVGGWLKGELRPRGSELLSGARGRILASHLVTFEIEGWV